VNDNANREKAMKKFIVLLRDFGYIWADGKVIEKGIRGFTSDRVLPHTYRDPMDACEMLCSTIREKEFTDRLVKCQQA
jgi:hypothetical protein